VGPPTVEPMTPAERLDDHRRHPRQLGKLMNASAVGDVGSIVVGDALRLYIRVAEGRIAEARFQVFNAAAQTAAASAVCEHVAGLTVAEAKALDAAAVRAHLGGLAADLLPALPWAITGLRSAIAQWEKTDLEEDEEREALFCRCHGIPETVVRESITLMRLTEPAQVVDATSPRTRRRQHARPRRRQRPHQPPAPRRRHHRHRREPPPRRPRPRTLGPGR
jgi:NifU-like protein